jgi:two-component system, sensor histidine kinase LadS
MKRYFIYLLLPALCALYTACDDKNSPEIITVSNISDFSKNDNPLLLHAEDHISLGKNLSILEDKSGKLTINDVSTKEYETRFFPSTKDVPYFEFTPSAYWVRFSLCSMDRENSQWILEMGYPLMDDIELYIQDQSGTIKSIKAGYDRPFKERQYQHRNFAYDIRLQYAQPRTFYMRFSCADRMEIPLVLYSPKGFQRYDHNTQYVLGIFFGFVVFMFIYNFLHFLSIRDRSYLTYCFFLISCSLFQITQNGTMYEYFWPSVFYSHNHFIPLSISLVDIGALLFTRKFLDLDIYVPRLAKVFKIMEIYFLATMVLPFFLSYPSIIRLMTVSSLIICIMTISSGFFSLKNNRIPSILFLSSGTVLAAGGIIYSLKVAGIVPSNFISNYAMQIGSVVQFLILSLGLGIRINSMRLDKEKALKQELLLQKRYSIIAEHSDDLIFSLDENLNFLSMNNTASKFLSTRADKNIPAGFLSLLFLDENKPFYSREMILAQIEKAKSKQTPLMFKAEFVSPSGLSPIEMIVRFEFITIHDRKEIVGRAWRNSEDTILKYFLSETQEYLIESLLPTLDEITNRITRNISRYADMKEVNLIRIGIREIIFNAIEHGNLNISYEEKTEAQINDNYFKLIEERRNDPENKDKRVHIAYSITAAKAEFKITDMGSGFDYKNLSARANEKNEQMLSHGRGIIMAKNVFDKVIYNDKGNVVTLVKYFDKTEQATS